MTQRVKPVQKMLRIPPFQRTKKTRIAQTVQRRKKVQIHLPPLQTRKTRNKERKVKKRKGFFTKLMKSAPDEQWLLKMVLWFPVGIGMSVALYFLVIQKMSLQEKYKLIIGCGLGFVLSLTFAFSVQMRCVMTLVVPTFVGKAGRSYFAAFAIVYLVNGPITNIMDNCEEIVRSMTCNSELTANHTKTKFNLRMHPVQHAVGDLLKDNFLVVRASKAIKKAFSPLTKELKDNENENREMESSIKDVERIGDKRDSDNSADKDAGKKVEKQWEKKMDLRCHGTFSNGVQRCRDKMRQLEDKCMDKLSFLGYIVCWPLKITVFCNLVKLIPGVIGMDCNAASQVSPGFGDTYVSARDVMDNMEDGAKVNLQYKVVGSADANYMPVEEMRQATIHEVKAKTDTINITLKVITHVLTFTFLIVFYGAYKYNGNYLTDLNWDNKYITAYFRHIDARRKDRGKRTLLPLKKAEKKELYDPNKIKLSAAERKKVVAGTIQLLLRVIISAIICYMDNIFYQVLDIIARNSKIEYHQTGEHVVDIKIYGKGFMSALVRSFLERFNSKQELDSLTTNYACLPRPSKTDVVILAFIFGTYMLVWVFLYFEAFGLRMRRVIAAFYYRKREKKRILYLYNERYRKRVGFLMHMRKKVRKQLRDREFQRKIGIILALKRQYPFLSKCLGVFKASKDTCIICGELETKGFHTCPTEGCGVGYCRECWIDIKKKCYACGQVSDNEEDSGSDSETADDGHFVL
ncbi:unnamed protein product [Candidula unifasciata]|uniref:Dendritic cell-specific transmembrane protein-like domain-containing protein n=1 Tax=Candidula unifasciata TaxID=100452 RepID=A0A8S3ZZH7_9EUPU|nr:unnamed protein product [Candidula unifasciata]